MAVLKDYNESTLKWEGVGAGYISNDDGTNKATPNEVRAMKDKIDGHAASQSNPHATNKSDVGLGNVDNVKQASKVEHDALDTKVSTHLAESMPHQFVDGAKTYNYGLKTNTAKDGLIFIYKEV